MTLCHGQVSTEYILVPQYIVKFSAKKVHFYYRKYALVSDLYIEWVNANPAIVMEEKEWK